MENKIFKKIEEKNEQSREKVEIIQLDEENLRIEGHPYKIIQNYRDGFDKDKFAERYSDVLKKYDYIVGDWGYDQLRLKGFYNKNFSQSKLDQQIENVEDYLLEYCNFGCAFFIVENLKKLPKKKIKIKNTQRVNNRKRSNVGNKSTPNAKKSINNKSKPKTTSTKTNKSSNKRKNFVIRKKEK